ncbi:uncharacterized protein LOC128211915 [Mya arenaria]|uniref:uncharacterized protein LOC128211915 n=1 Tax=Mya arenaria TaxID=6604 RepID=UPI0022E6EB0B|nr:uncharacterized protein LOC128211915 [Mya arenaria]
MSHLAVRLHADVEECFIVSAKNPNVLGSDKGKAYFCEDFKFCQKAFSRHICNYRALKCFKMKPTLMLVLSGKKHVEISRPNVSFAQHSRPTDGNRSSQSVVQVKIKKVSDNVKVNTKRTNIEDQIKESPSLLLGKALPPEGTPRKANADEPVVPVTPASNDDDNDSWSNSDDKFKKELENKLPDMSAFIGRTPIKLDQDAKRSVKSLSKCGSALQKITEACQEPAIKKHNEECGVRSYVSARKNERATNSSVIAGTSDECKQGANSNSVEIQSFTCVVKSCLREFIARWRLLKHYQSHTETKRITCRECDENLKAAPPQSSIVEQPTHTLRNCDRNIRADNSLKISKGS